MRTYFDRAHSAFLMTLCALHFALCPFEDYFSYRHFNSIIKTERLPEVLFKHGQLTIQRRAIKFKIFLVTAATVEGLAARTANRVLPGFL